MTNRQSATGRSFGGVVGVILLTLAAGLLGWNEISAANEERALAEGAVTVQEAPADRVDPSLNDHLVHMTGPLRVPGVLTDPDFPTVRAPPGTVQLRRAVQTYQWRERTSRASASYDTVWSDQTIDSTRFRRPGSPQNPPPRYQARSLVAPEAWLGPYRLTAGLLGQLTGGEALAPAADMGRSPPGVQLYGGGLYAGVNPDTPAIGDQRITWEAVRADAVSVVARQRGAGFVPYQTRSGPRVHLVAAGLLSAEEMIVRAEEANTAGAWMLRVVGTGLLFFAFVLLLRSSAAPAGGTSLLGRMVDVGPAQGAALLTVAGAPVIIAVAWLAVRPVVGASMLSVGAALAWWMVRRGAPG